MEISDAENLNGTLGTTTAGDDVDFSLANTFGLFSVVTDTLNAGRYEFTLNTDESRFVIQNQGVPRTRYISAVTAEAAVRGDWGAMKLSAETNRD